MLYSKLKFFTAVAAVISLGLLFGPNAQAALFANPSYNATTVFHDALGSTTMTLAHDGSSYWSTSGGSGSGVREARYTSAGTLLATYSPSLDFRSVFTDSLGGVYAREYSSSTIYKQVAPGSFAANVVLSGGSLDAQSSVVLNGAGTEYIAMNAGVVQRWSLAGAFLGSVSLLGYGSLGSEGIYPQNRGIAAVGNYWLTYSGGTLSGWDSSGNRVDTAILNGAGTSFDSHFSLSYANGKVFIVDQAGGNWRGYDVVEPVPEPSTYLAGALLALVFGVQGFRTLRNRKTA